MAIFEFPDKLQSNRDNISVILAVVMILLGAYDIAHGAVFIVLYTYVQQINQQQQAPVIVSNLTSAQYLSPSIFLIVSGFVVIVIYIFVICNIRQVVKRNDARWLKIVNGLLTLSFGLQFGVGIISGLAATQYDVYYSQYSQSTITQNAQTLPAGPERSFLLLLPNGTNMTTANSVLAFVPGAVIAFLFMVALKVSITQNQQFQSNRTMNNEKILIQKSVM